jgi:uncharacterized repeat protein (TIGR01451 family)
MRAARNSTHRRLTVALLTMAALVVALLPQTAVGFTSGKLFATRFVDAGGTRFEPTICVGDTAQKTLVYELSNVSTQNVSMGSANISLPSAIQFASASVTSTSSGNHTRWTALYNDSLHRIELRSARNQDGVGRGGWVRITLGVRLAASASAATYVWGQNPPLASNVNVFVKQSNNFSCSGNDLLPSSRAQDLPPATLKVESCVDLAISKSSSPSEVTVGDTVLYSVRVTNKTGSSATTGVVLTDTLPANRDQTAGVNIRSCWLNGSQVVCPEGLLQNGSIVWTIGSLGVGGTAEIRYALRAPASTGTMTNKASVTSDDEVFAHSNCSSASTSDNCAVLTLDVEEREDETTRSSYLCSTPDTTCSNELTTTGVSSTGRFTLVSGEGSFLFQTTDCTTTNEDCLGSIFDLVPDCLSDCRGLLTLEFDHSLGATASHVAHPDDDDCVEDQCYWMYYEKPGMEESLPMPKCTTTVGSGVGSPQSGGGWNNPPGTILDVNSDIPCVWKYFDPGTSGKVQFQIVIDGEDPRSILR